MQKVTLVQGWIASLDHLIGAGEQRRRHAQADRLGGLEIDRELEFGGLHDRQVGRLGTRWTARVDADDTIRLGDSGSASLRLDVEGPDDVAPLLRFVGDELAESVAEPTSGVLPKSASRALIL